jgi:hypothetical protein
MLAVPVPFNIDHVPPAVASVKAAVVAFTQTTDAPPAIGATTVAAFTVSEALTVFDPQPLTVYCTVTVPELKPVTTPPCVMLAVPVPFNIDHVPPAVASVKAAVVAFTQTTDAPPAIGAATVAAFTVSEALTVFDPQPLTVYCTVTVPELKPVTTPPCVMLAVPVPFNIDHVPPAVASVKAAVIAFTQTTDAPPAIGATTVAAFTVSEALTVFDPQPLTVYCTVTVPELKPVTTPPCVMLAVPVPFNIDHVPPAVASVKAAVVAFTQTTDAPSAIGAATVAAFTVSEALTVFDPQPLTVY